MAGGAKKLGAPKGATEAASAAVTATASAADIEADRIRRLSDRYASDGQAALSWPGTPPPASPAPPTKPARPPRTEPDGMTRRTYYLPTDAADELAAAVERIQRATGGQVPKHVALGAIVMAGAAQTDELIPRLREVLLRRLTGEEDDSHTGVDQPDTEV
jgi:hypothetical protein